MLRIRRIMFPIKLSQGLEIVNELKTKEHIKPHWYNTPVRSLIGHVGDIPVTRVAPADVLAWYDEIQRRQNQRDPNKRLSAWTVDSYARAVRAYFNHLHTLGHVAQPPTRCLRLPRLPEKGKKAISGREIKAMLRCAKGNPRDYAMIRVLRDSGCRAGGLVSMKVFNVVIQKKGGKRRGKVLVREKMNKCRYVYLGHKTCKALQRYMKIRPYNASDDLWLSNSGAPLTTSGVYQALKRVGMRADVEYFNPHAFRHALAKRMAKNGAPSRAIQKILGHEDVTTTLNMYVEFDDTELQELHQRYYN